MKKNYRVVFTDKCKVELQECEIPKPAENEILTRAIITQISTGTELTSLENNVTEDSYWNGSINYPVYPGYSCVGEIIAVGENCDKSLIGKRIFSTCHHEKYSILDVDSQEYCLVDDNIDSDDAVFRSLAVVSLASIRAAKIRPGETVVVYGAGLVGQLVARFAKIAGAVNVIVVDVSDNRLSYVPQDSTFITVNSTKEDVHEVIKKANFGNLADIVFETTSYHPLVKEEISCLAKLGRLIITSSPKGVSNVDFHYCSGMGITIIGAHNHAIHTPVGTPENPWTRQRDGKYVLQLLEKEQISFKDMITHKDNYKNAVELYELLMQDRTQALAVHIDWRD